MPTIHLGSHACFSATELYTNLHTKFFFHPIELKSYSALGSLQALRDHYTIIVTECINLYRRLKQRYFRSDLGGDKNKGIYDVIAYMRKFQENLSN